MAGVGIAVSPSRRPSGSSASAREVGSGVCPGAGQSGHRFVSPVCTVHCTMHRTRAEQIQQESPTPRGRVGPGDGSSRAGAEIRFEFGPLPFPSPRPGPWLGRSAVAWQGVVFYLSTLAISPFHSPLPQPDWTLPRSTVLHMHGRQLRCQKNRRKSPVPSYTGKEAP